MYPIEVYHLRYLQLFKEIGISTNETDLLNVLSHHPIGLNNYFMAGLGMGTLMLRMGAVIQTCRKFEELDDQGDALFLKQIVDNLRETLPSDTNWKNLWSISAQDDAWRAPTIQPKGGQALLDRFVTFRNRFVHQQIRLIPEHSSMLSKGIEMLEEMARLNLLFKQGELIFLNAKYYWKTKETSVCLHPYLQKGDDEQAPYIFQGLYDNKSRAHLLNTRYGNETDQDAEAHLEPVFTPIREALRGGAGQVFDHSERIAYYRSCFVGRDRERDALLNFCRSKDEQNILCIKSPAGMGKGALIADVIYQLKEDRTQLLYHFCGAGIQNSLHASLYHFIIQGKNYWDRSDEMIQRKLDRLPSKYTDVIQLFHDLLTENLKIQKNNDSGNLVILIDGLDEAQVAYAQLNISDWFYTYDDKGEPEEDWRSASNIRWVFTYRCDDNGEESFYRFPKMKECAEIELLQPLQGLNSSAAEEAFMDFNVSSEFLQSVIEKAVIH